MGPATATPTFFFLVLSCVAAGILIYIFGAHRTGLTIVGAGVALFVLHRLPDRGLLRGQVGTIVENLAPGVFEVEFSDEQGRTYAQLALKENQLLRLHFQPQRAA